MKPQQSYTVSREPEHDRFPWIVTDSHGNPALWRDDRKVGKVPQRFRTEAFAQAAADRLNATAGT